MNKFTKTLNCAASISLLIGAISIGTSANAAELSISNIKLAQTSVRITQAPVQVEVLTNTNIVDKLANHNNNNNNNNNNHGSTHHNNNNNNNNNNNRLGLNVDRLDTLVQVRNGFQL